MKSIFLITTFFIQVQLTFIFAQDYSNCEKILVLEGLRNLGFDTIPGSKLYLKDSTCCLIARFNENYCSRISYHLAQDGDDLLFCDSIHCTSSCVQCFDITLHTFLKNKRKNWKKETDQLYYSLKSPGKTKLTGRPGEVTYHIQKIAIINASENNHPEFFLSSVSVSKAEFKRIKRLKSYP